MKFGPYTSHPAADLFPLLPDGELETLAEDIKANGQRVPIVALGRQILDGRNRWLACQKAGVKPRFEKRKFRKHDSIVGYVVSLNVNRRHLTPSQRALIAAEALPFFAKEAKDRQRKGGLRAPVPKAQKGRARDQAAATTGVSSRYVEQAKTLKATAPKTLVREVRDGKVTLSQALKREKKKKAVANVKRFRWPTGKFPVISVDPAWKFDKRAEDETHRDGAGYPRMTVEEVCRLKIPSADDCMLFLWCPNAFVAEGVHARVLKAWGFTPITTGTWIKGNKIGLGDWLRGNSEQYILAIRGSPTVNNTGQTTANDWPYCGPSRKPPEFFKMVESLCPATPRLEMFACEEREGWVAAGSEVQAL